MNADAHPRFVKVVLQTGFQDCNCLKSCATTKSVRIRNIPGKKLLQKSTDELRAMLRKLESALNI